MLNYIFVRVSALSRRPAGRLGDSPPALELRPELAQESRSYTVASWRN